MLPTFAQDNKGNVYINDFKRYVKGVVLVPDAAANPLTVLPAPAPGAPTPSIAVILEGGQDSVAEIFSLIGAHDATVAADVRARFTVQISDRSYRRMFMNRPILVDHVFGTPLNPFFLTESVLLENQQVLEFTFFNNSVVGNEVFRQLAEARKYQATALTNDDITRMIAELRQRKLYLNPYWLTQDQPLTLPAGRTREIFFYNTRDNFLVLQYLMGRVITTGVAGDTQEIISIQVFDAKTDRPLQNVPFTLNTGTGTAQFPYKLPAPLFVEPATALRVRVTNLITDQPTEVFLTWHGIAIFVSDQNPWQDQLVDNPVAEAYYHGAP